MVSVNYHHIVTPCTENVHPFATISCTKTSHTQHCQLTALCEKQYETHSEYHSFPFPRQSDDRRWWQTLLIHNSCVMHRWNATSIDLFNRTYNEDRSKLRFIGKNSYSTRKDLNATFPFCNALIVQIKR
jgi:hypothetical protein